MTAPSFNALKKLPIGIQTFEDLIQGNYVYVDKTPHLYQLVSPPKGVYFLSRPRRFGKSLLISTLEAIFLGKKELFNGLFIEQTDYDWRIHPVIRVDMTQVLKRNQNFNDALLEEVQGLCRRFNIDPTFTHTASGLFRYLIEQLGQQEKVVILIDEYDKPILDGITEPDRANENREILKEFYTIIKAQDENVRFVLLTGVTKFSKVSVFSGLKNLQDLTMTGQAAPLCGYTQNELQASFKGHIKRLSTSQNMTISQSLQKIQDWYNGYQFSENAIRVYNPFSTLLLFQHCSFKAYWFETGTPTFLVNLLKKHKHDIDDIDGIELGESGFSTFDLDYLNPIALLFQTGYLTIRNYDPVGRWYTLGYPNFEVKEAFLEAVLTGFSILDTPATAFIRRLSKAVMGDDIESIFSALSVFFSNIPYDIQIKSERYYQSIFYLIFTILGFTIQTEVKTNRGRIDAVVETDKTIYIFEFKLNDTAQSALTQIKTQGYAKKYSAHTQTVLLIGVAFDCEKREISEWKTERM